MLTKNDKDWVIGNFATKYELTSEMAKMEERIESKAQKRHNELMNLFDGQAKQLKDNEEFRLVTNHRLDKLEGVSF